MVGDDFPHGADTDVTGHLRAEEIVAGTRVGCAVELVGVLYLDAVVCSAFGTVASGEIAGNDFGFAWCPIGAGEPAGKRTDADHPAGEATCGEENQAEDNQ